MSDSALKGWTEWISQLDEANSQAWFDGWRVPPVQAEGETLLCAALVRWAVIEGDAVAAEEVDRWLPGLLALTDARVHLKLAVADWAESDVFDYAQVISAEKGAATLSLTTHLPGGGHQRDIFRIEDTYAAHQPEVAQTMLDIFKSGGLVRTCTSCGGRIGDQEKYCRHCGHEQSNLCPGCGEPISPHHKFCEHCGSAQARS